VLQPTPRWRSARLTGRRALGGHSATEEQGVAVGSKARLPLTRWCSAKASLSACAKVQIAVAARPALAAGVSAELRCRAALSDHSCLRDG